VFHEDHRRGRADKTLRSLGRLPFSPEPTSR
jgi:hypothetical protein